MKRLSSEATGLLKAASGQSAQDGPQHGGSGSVSAPSGSALTGASTAQAAGWLASMRTDQVDNRLQSRLQRFGFSISIKTESRFPPGGGLRTVPVAATLTPHLPSTEFTGFSADERAAQAIADAEKFMTPPTRDQVIAWLGDMDAVTARRQGDDADTHVTIAAYGKRLQEYPADVVKAVLHGWPSKSKWWPAWADLEPDLERLTKPRRLMIRALQQPRADDGEPVTMTPTPERRSQLIDEIRPMLDEMRARAKNSVEDDHNV